MTCFPELMFRYGADRSWPRPNDKRSVSGGEIAVNATKVRVSNGLPIRKSLFRASGLSATLSFEAFFYTTQHAAKPFELNNLNPEGPS